MARYNANIGSCSEYSHISDLSTTNEDMLSLSRLNTRRLPHPTWRSTFGPIPEGPCNTLAYGSLQPSASYDTGKREMPHCILFRSGPLLSTTIGWSLETFLGLVDVSRD